MPKGTKAKPRNVVLVVIDQFRFDYHRHLGRSRKFLQALDLCDTHSFPTCTETMHANISTGEYPSGHGIISDCYFDEGRAPGECDFFSMFTDLSESFGNNGRVSVAGLAQSQGYDVICIGGKAETVQLLGVGSSPFAQISRGDKGRHQIDAKPRAERAIKEKIRQINLGSVSKEGRYEPHYDEWVFGAVKPALEVWRDNQKEARSLLLMLALPALDYIGHKYGPNSPEVIRSLRVIDGILCRLRKLFHEDETLMIVLGDHGCRQVDVAAILDKDEDPAEMLVYRKETTEDGPQFRLDEEKIQLDSDFLDHVRFMQPDGGMIRIWLRDVGERPRVIGWLSSKLEGLGRVEDPTEPAREGTIRANSQHSRLGDVVVLADPNTAFFRNRWCPGYDPKTPKKTMRCGLDMFVGEHGSHHDEDRHVALMVSRSVDLKKVCNTGILRILKGALG